MLWLKAFHIVGVVSWFAGLLYLPRLFVYHADAAVYLAFFIQMNEGIDHRFRKVFVHRKTCTVPTAGCPKFF